MLELCDFKAWALELCTGLQHLQPESYFCFNIIVGTVRKVENSDLALLRVHEPSSWYQHQESTNDCLFPLLSGVEHYERVASIFSQTEHLREVYVRRLLAEPEHVGPYTSRTGCPQFQLNTYVLLTPHNALTACWVCTLCTSKEQSYLETED
ncbi:hypothetical protein BJY04DRAFT_195889 [Aspergillus karnatakaensis]|uniref:uncharacterized protein n=1 Tax=Aspergillus karnatakaensis TaxID=1810916 RepID=UPI003CCD7EDA